MKSKNIKDEERVIKAFDEFGFILWYHLPRAYHFFLKGQLEKTYSKIGTKALFYFSPMHIEEKRHETPFDGFTASYHFKAPHYTKSEWAPPPLNEVYKNDKIVFDKPILTVHNKNTLEWGNSGLFNYFDKSSLDKIFNEYYDKFQIIYIRPVPKENNVKLQHDFGEDNIDIGDLDLINNKYPNILWIGDMFEKYQAESYNELQFMILANSDKHIAPAGDAAIPAYFGGDLLIYKSTGGLGVHRGIWKTNSWLKKFSKIKTVRFMDYESLLTYSKNIWK